MKFTVSPAKQKDLAQRMTRCNLREADMEESFVNSDACVNSLLKRPY